MDAVDARSVRRRAAVAKWRPLWTGVASAVDTTASGPGVRMAADICW
jgi:hypothetical protein